MEWKIWKFVHFIWHNIVNLIITKKKSSSPIDGPSMKRSVLAFQNKMMVYSQKLPWVQGIPWLQVLLLFQHCQGVQGVHLVQLHPKHHKRIRVSVSVKECKGLTLNIRFYCLLDWTYSRSNFAIRTRASRATSHTLCREDSVNAHHAFININVAPTKKHVAVPTLDPGAPGAPGLPASPVAPWAPSGPGAPRSPGIPCQTSAEQLGEKSTSMNYLEYEQTTATAHLWFTHLASSSSIITRETTSTKGTLMKMQTHQQSVTEVYVLKWIPWECTIC